MTEKMGDRPREYQGPPLRSNIGVDAEVLRAIHAGRLSGLHTIGSPKAWKQVVREFTRIGRT